MTTSLKRKICDRAIILTGIIVGMLLAVVVRKKGAIS